jgi:hypothetical protein
MRLNGWPIGFPCQRFTLHLTVQHARLGVWLIRHFLPVSNFHRLSSASFNWRSSFGQHIFLTPSSDAISPYQMHFQQGIST